MNLLRASAREAAAASSGGSGRPGAGVQVALAPPYTAIDVVGDAIRGSGLLLAAQDVAAAHEGAYTGEVSAAMLVDAGVGLVIVGHSERRHGLGETDAVVLEKVHRAGEAGLQVTLCVGETGDERDAGRAEEVVERQVDAVVDLGRVPLHVAYEPVWAIGTGRTATHEDARSMHAHIRATVAAIAGRDAAEALIIQYGGSVKPDNSAALLAQDGVDGLLVGGASLDAASFAAVVPL
ncbi:Triosephosphate isomerase [Geodia barretti]|uniref:Triosephosphate isomerase n=1 Tax=Geodia barretti TaxID=519541 RepID=A0AA35XBA4_GEOBA|nr:Triosephosphate isomerase [Geodia barretti]